jgi:hypothetical protein
MWNFITPKVDEFHSTKFCAILWNLGQLRILYGIYGIKKTYGIQYKRNSENTLLLLTAIKLEEYKKNGGT